MMKPIVLIATLCAVGVAGCTEEQKRVTYDGQYFRGKPQKVDKQRDQFVISIKGVSKSASGARQAAHHRGTEYCVENFGTSNITWNVDPLDEEVALNVTNDTVTFTGSCPQAQRL